MILTSLKLALGALRKNIARTILTIFGITIGIGLVIIVLSAGNALKGLVLGEIDSFGDDWIQIEVKVPSTQHVSRENASDQARGVSITTMTYEDAKAIEKLDNIKYVYAGITSQAVVSYKNEKERPLIFAVTADYIKIDKGDVALGRFFSEDEERGAAQVTVLGADLAEDLFGNDDALGQNVKVDGKSYRVVGVMEKRGVTGFFNFDEVMILPLRTTQRKIMGINHILWVTAQTHNNDLADATAEEIRWLLRQRHDITDPDKDDFGVTTLEESMAIVDTIFLGITWLLIGLATISLLVAGVGIMNVMYVSVAERTFEIGLRKSVGARKRDILWQFLVEAVVITLIGGIIGMIGGITISFLVATIAQYLNFNWEFSISLFGVMLALSFSTIVGLIFGIYPAKKAADLDPITALRQE